MLKSSYFWVGLGGAIGAIARVGITNILPPSILNIPIKILLVNVIGCLIAGILIELMAFQWNASIEMRHFLIQGLLGGFTTFSAFAIEFGMLYEKGSHALSFVYGILTVILGISFLFLGLRVTRLFL